MIELKLGKKALYPFSWLWTVFRTLERQFWHCQSFRLQMRRWRRGEVAVFSLSEQVMPLVRAQAWNSTSQMLMCKHLSVDRDTYSAG